MKTLALAAAALLGAAAPSLAAGEAGPAAQFETSPAPPASLKEAAARVKIGTGDEPRLRAPMYDAASKKLNDGVKDSGAAAAQQQMDESGVGVDVQRLQSDPAYAERFRAKMEAMSPAEKMAMAQNMAASQRAAAMNQPRGQAMAHGQTLAALGQGSQEERKAQAAVRALLDGALKDSDERHAAVDKEIDAAAKACPADKTGWPLASCTDSLGKRGIEKHRAAETQALAGENAAYVKARALAKKRVDALALLIARADEGGRRSDVSAVTANIGLYTSALLRFARTAALRAGFWSGKVATAYRSHEAYFLKAGDDHEIGWPPSAEEDRP